MGGGDTGVGGNGSVYWRTTHYGRDQQKRRLRTKPAGQPHGNDEIDIDNNDAFGKDAETDVAEVGARLGHRGYFLVTLRFRTMKEAEAAGAWVAQNVRPGLGGFLLTVRVPAIDRSDPQVDPPFEVRVEW
jgi:hypothetical protein